MNLRTIIVDDERIARQRLRRLLAREPEVEIIAECADGVSAVEAVKEQAPDLLFLDIQMPGVDGFEVVDAIMPIAQPAIVFITAFDRHAVHAFETCALDYLLKPVEPARLAKTLQRVRAYLMTSPPVSPSRASLPNGTTSAQRFGVRSGQRMTFVAPKEIDWIEADGNYAILHVGARNHLLRETMNALEAQLPPNDFVRVSRSAIVRLEKVEGMQVATDGHHFLVLNDGQRVPVTRKIRDIEARIRSR
jgi:two-component system LytT family response regulator